MRLSLARSLACGVGLAIVSTVVVIGRSVAQEQPASVGVAVTRGDLARTLSTTGTLRAASTWTVPLQSDEVTTARAATSALGGSSGAASNAGQKVSTAAATFVVTSIAASGDEIGFGETLYAIDGLPVILVPGRTGAYRTLQTAITDGPDVQQLEAYLASVGFDPVNVDAHFDSDTKAAVKLWQTSIGRAATGTMDVGDVVFAATPVVIESALVSPGDSASDGTPMLTVRSSDLVAEIAVTDQLSSVMAVGEALQARLPDGSSMSVTVELIVNDPVNGRVALARPGGPPAVTATPVPLTVSYTMALATDALIVDALAVIHLEGDRDVVKLVSGELVPVTIIATTGTKTAVSSDTLTTSSRLAP